MAVSQQHRERIKELLGREPRGLEDVPVTSSSGQPMVIRVASLVEDKPFPTLFWLVDAALCYRIDTEEAGGLIAQLQQRIDESAQYQAQMADDHGRHIALRDSFIGVSERQRIASLGFSGVFQQKGIGGISDFTRIRCLHTWYAAHLVVSNTVGVLLDEHWRQAGEQDCI